MKKKFSTEGHNVGQAIAATPRQEFYPSPSASTTKVDTEISAIRAFPIMLLETRLKSALGE